MKFFPKNAKPSIKKIQKPSRVISRFNELISIKKSFSLKEEFDLLIKHKYSSISEAGKQRIWKIISTNILENKIHIGTLTLTQQLDQIIKKNL